LNRGIKSARDADGSSLPEKIWLKVKLLLGWFMKLWTFRYVYQEAYIVM